MNVKSWTLAQFRPENIFNAKIGKKVLIITTDYYVEL